LIDIQITIKGENVQNSSFKKYYYPHESDEKIFFNSVQLVAARIEKKLKLSKENPIIKNYLVYVRS